MVSRIVNAVRGNLVAWLALFVAMGGTSLAANHYLINSTKQISPKVLKKLKGNRGAAGAQGAPGAPGARGSAGATGATGATGTVDTSKFFSKTESDGKYLGKGEQAADSAKLAGVAASGYTSGEGSQGGRFLEMVNHGKEENFLAVPGIGELSLECLTEPTKATNATLTEHAGSPVFLTWGSVPDKQVPRMETAVLKEGGPTSLTQTFAPAENGTGQMIIQASGDLSTSVHTYATITVSAAVTEGVCRFQGNYTVAQQRF
jgi:hypothetical protein